MSDRENVFEISWSDNQITGVFIEKKYSLQKVLTSSINPMTLSENGITLNPEFEKILSSILNTFTNIEENTKKIIFSDYVFGSLYPIPSPPNPKLQSEFWKAILKKVWSWEDQNETIHKGTPYFFMATAYLRARKAVIVVLLVMAYMSTIISTSP